MKKLQKGFTLVELIVVITILAILGTIAFISLQGYSQDAKNSKVSSDLKTLASAIEISNTNGATNVRTILDNAKNTTVLANTGGTFASTLSSTGMFITGSIMVDNNLIYGIGGVNFAGLQQNGADFKDSSTTPRDYVYAFAATGSVAFYQIAGQITEKSGSTTVYVKGNYIATATGTSSDRPGLVRGTASTTGLVHLASDSIGGY